MYLLKNNQQLDKPERYPPSVYEVMLWRCVCVCVCVCIYICVCVLGLLVEFVYIWLCKHHHINVFSGGMCM